MMPEINMYNIDCLEFMKDKPDNFYQLAIVDPPYGININKRGNYNYNVGKKISRLGWTVKEANYKMGIWDKNKPNKEYFNELFRISKNQIIWGINHFGISFDGGIVWDKNIGEDFSMSQCEIAKNTCIKTIRKFKYMWCGMVQGDNGNAREKRIHPTQKPIELYRWLLKNYAKKGDKILDTHGGSGSICIACHDMGFDLDWCELDKDYYAAAVKRFNKHKQQIRMF